MSLWNKIKSNTSVPGKIKVKTSGVDENKFSVPVGMRRDLGSQLESSEDPTDVLKSPTSTNMTSSLIFKEESADKLESYKRLLDCEKIDMKSLKSLAWKGIPAQYRSVTWRLLLGYLPSVKSRQASIINRKRREYMDYVNRLYNVSDADRTEDELSTLRQISVDVPRTSYGSILLRSSDMQLRLKRLLYIWANRHPASGYVQGINDLTMPFLTVFLNDHYPNKLTELDFDDVESSVLDDIEADTYYCVSRLLDGIQDHYTTDQPGIQCMVRKLEDLVRRIDNSLFSHIQEEGLLFLQFAFRYMNCLLIREFNMETIVRLWDTYLCEDRGFDIFHVYVCAVLIKLSKEELLRKDFQSMLIYLQNPPTDTWTDQDVEELISQAYVLKTLFEDTSI